MKVIKKYNQMRRDLDCDVVCEGCGNEETINNAYDDRNYWDNVIPNRECKNCKKTSNDLGVKIDFIQTRYPEGEQH